MTRILRFEEFRQMLETLYATVYEFRIGFEPDGFITVQENEGYRVETPGEALLPIRDWEHTLTGYDWSTLQALKLTIHIMGSSDSIKLLERYGINRVFVALSISGPPHQRKLYQTPTE